MRRPVIPKRGPAARARVRREFYPMKSSDTTVADRALLDYFDDLLQDSIKPVPDTVPNPVIPTRLLPLANALPRPVRTVASRPFAEPIRTLNLRVPLPPQAPVDI